VTEQTTENKPNNNIALWLHVVYVVIKLKYSLWTLVYYRVLGLSDGEETMTLALFVFTDHDRQTDRDDIPVLAIPALACRSACYARPTALAKINSSLFGLTV